MSRAVRQPLSQYWQLRAWMLLILIELASAASTGVTDVQAAFRALLAAQEPAELSQLFGSFTALTPVVIPVGEVIRGHCVSCLDDLIVSGAVNYQSGRLLPLPDSDSAKRLLVWLGDDRIMQVHRVMRELSLL